MRSLYHLDKYKIPFFRDMGDENNGVFRLKLNDSFLEFTVIATSCYGWDHVSVSTEKRYPNWNEMQQIKDLFFEAHEIAMQLHSSPSENDNIHQYCLHIWRPHEIAIPVPPPISIGGKEWRKFWRAFLN